MKQRDTIEVSSMTDINTYGDLLTKTDAPTESIQIDGMAFRRWKETGSLDVWGDSAWRSMPEAASKAISALLGMIQVAVEEKKLLVSRIAELEDQVAMARGVG